MSRISFASHPFLLGFEQLDQLVERTAKASGDGYPPYNIEQRGEDAYRITLAVAGFSFDDLSITLEDGHLVVRGKQAEDDEGRLFLHRGIAARQFQRSFVLADSGARSQVANLWAAGLVVLTLVLLAPVCAPACINRCRPDALTTRRFSTRIQPILSK